MEIVGYPIDACKNLIRSLSICICVSTLTVCNGTYSDDDMSFTVLFSSKQLICGTSGACIYQSPPFYLVPIKIVSFLYVNFLLNASIQTS